MKPDLLTLLAKDELSVTGDEVDGLLSLFEYIAGMDAAKDIRSTISHVLLRAIEIELLSSPLMVDIALNPGIYMGSERSIIAKELEERLGVAPPEVVAHYRRLLLSGSAGSAKKQSVEPHFEAVLRAHLSNSSELRCVICGYHFVDDDLGELRRTIARDLGLELATQRLSRRLRDPWKSPDKTTLELDHWIPEAGLGPTEAGNLRVTCRFCNGCKSYWRWPGEMTAACVATSLLCLGDTTPGSRGYRSAEAATFFAIAIRGTCSRCDRPACAVELTALVDDRRRFPTRPWALKAACYECYEPN